MRVVVWTQVVLMVALAGLWLRPAAIAAPAPTGQAEGTIAAVDAASLLVNTRAGGQVRILISSDTRIVQRKTVRLEDIRPNEFVGVTAKREPDGSLTAVSINIFPPEYRGRIPESQFLMATGNIMTNAMVFQNVRRVDGRTLYLKLPDGTAVISVPRSAEVFRLTLVKSGDLRPGMQVLVRGTPAQDGAITAATITVEVP
jgi:hypothetical protein